MTGVLVDTGPLVAFIDRREEHHAWARDILGKSPAPALVCEAVLAEAAHLLRHVHGGHEALGTALARGGLAIQFDLAVEHQAVFALLKRYASVPMSLADACLVRMSELLPAARLLTIDSDFTIYRRFKRERIPMARP